MSTGRDIIIILVVTILAFLGAFFQPGSFLIQPSFEIILTTEQSENIVMETLTITNNGGAQAKNTKIHITISDKTTIVSDDCPEGYSQIGYEDDYIELKLEKMSSNLPCIVQFESSKINSISRIVVTADDSSAYIWNYEEKQSKKLDPEIYAGFAGIVGITAGIITFVIIFVNHKKSKEKKLIQKFIDQELMQIKLDKAIFVEGEKIKGFVLIRSTVDMDNWKPIKMDVADPNGLVVYSAAIPRLSATSSEISIQTGDPNWELFGMYTIYLEANDGTKSQSQFIYEKNSSKQNQSING